MPSGSRCWHCGRRERELEEGRGSFLCFFFSSVSVGCEEAVDKFDVEAGIPTKHHRFSETVFLPKESNIRRSIGRKRNLQPTRP